MALVQKKEMLTYIFLKVCTAVDSTNGIEDLTCPDDCTNPSQGVCNSFDGTCICMTGFAGHNCAGKKSTIILKILLK